MNSGKGPTETVITYLEMPTQPVTPTPATPALKHAIMRANMPTLAYYRFLYNGVGLLWNWYERNLLSDGELATIIHDQDVGIYVLHVDGVPAGYAELDWRKRPDCELAYFGLMPEFLGRGFGPYFLRWAIDQAWAENPKRLWVHTCTLDHPKALTLYQQAGFGVYAQEQTAINLPEIKNSGHR